MTRRPTPPPAKPARKTAAAPAKARPAPSASGAAGKPAGPGPAAPLARRQGGLAAITRNGLVGWAWDPAHPEETPTVAVLAGGQVIGTARADRFDDWIARMHGRPGLPGFLIRLHGLPQGEAPLQLQLVDMTGTPLGAPFLVADPAVLAAALDPAFARLEGSVDSVADGMVAGWVYDPLLPEDRVPVELVEGDRVLASGVADRFRGDLEAAGKGDGAYGFALPLPTNLIDGRFHALRVRVAGSEHFIGGQEIGVGPAAATALAQEVAQLTQEVARLTRLVDSLTDPSSPLQTEILRLLTARISAFSEIQREQVERELDALRRIAFAPREDGRLHLDAAAPAAGAKAATVTADAKARPGGGRPPRRRAAAPG